MDPNDRVAQPRIDPARTPFEDTAAFRRYGVTSDPAPDALEALYTKAVIQEQGFDGLPHVVSRRELDRYIAGGETELFRGVTLAAYAEAFRDGEFFVGRGGGADGVYTATGATSLAVARAYARGGVILRMSLKLGARVIALDELEQQARVAAAETTERLRRDQETVAATALDDDGHAAAEQVRAAFEQRIASARALYNDPGRYAAYLGYDAVREAAAPDEYIVILNRTAVRGQREDMS